MKNIEAKNDKKQVARVEVEVIEQAVLPEGYRVEPEVIAAAKAEVKAKKPKA